MLSRIPLHRLDGLRPIINRYLAPTCSHRRLLSDSPATTAAAAIDRRWVLLSSEGRRRRPDDSSFFADDNNVAVSRTTNGRRLRVSIRCAAPPSSSYLYYDFSETSYDNSDSIRVVAANGESVLFKMPNGLSYCANDYFVYRPAAGAGRRPPSLSLLPVLEFPTKSAGSVPASYFYRSRLDSGAIGLLRRGENDDLLVVHIDLWYDWDAGWEKVVFCVLRPGMPQWELMEPVPVGQSYRLFGIGSPGNVICVGDRFLCCIIWYRSGFLLCDMADEASPRVRQVGLPPAVMRCSYGRDDNPKKFRRMGAASDSSVRFVSIHPLCCSVERYDDPCCGCGHDSDKTECMHPRFVFTIKTWTMDLSMDEPLEWVEDGEIDSDEIWALPGYEGLPPVFPEWPVVCLGEANVICFSVSNYDFTRDVENSKVWMVHLNIKTKALLSVVELDHHGIEYYHLPGEFQY